ncbi:Glycosyl hydrolases family 25 [Amycolatopsis marina]|uniref:Glycosyl hydrolases family 25 n=1 Tax=Amycolatopsis marina TaxID=490629 RepID=A0A1I1BH18_9PSEU|nr:GH25 family lysozyme [Amycolatopsis marina]SFB49664.1 Glycosyl hydrolases family 25 [Amycolatopsis marina]
MALGLDIYRYQTVNDWGAVRDHGVTFIWVKLTDGGGQAITPGDRQVGGARSVGIPVGGYHYAQLSPSPERQADVLLGEVTRLGANDLVPMLDLESPFSPDATARDFGIRFCRRIRSRGYQPGVYMNNSFAANLRPDRWDPAPVVWIARYGARPDYGGHYDVHQYSSSGRVPGISGAVDLNESYTNRHFARRGEEEDEMTTLLPPGENQSVTLCVPTWARYLFLGLGDVRSLTVHSIHFFGDDFPADPDKFDGVGGGRGEYTLHRNRPTMLGIPPGAVQVSIRYTQPEGRVHAGAGFRSASS